MLKSAATHTASTHQQHSEHTQLIVDDIRFFLSFVSFAVSRSRFLLICINHSPLMIMLNAHTHTHTNSSLFVWLYRCRVDVTIVALLEERIRNTQFIRKMIFSTSSKKKWTWFLCQCCYNTQTLCYASFVYSEFITTRPNEKKINKILRHLQITFFFVFVCVFRFF